MDYTSHSDADRKRMLDAIGVGSLEELLANVIPDKFRTGTGIAAPNGLCELDLTAEFKGLAGENNPAAEGVSFLGGGVYDHYIPAVISHIIGRSEFYTAYTPYQAEVAQGTLQTIYEFQTMVCRLMAMDAANASHYDGATALAEAALLAVRKTERKVVVAPYGLNPSYRQALETYCTPTGVEIRDLKSNSGVIDLNELRVASKDAAAIIVQHPNFFGLLEPAVEAAKIAHEASALLISSTYPTSLALLTPPGEWGADIATAEGQPLGVPMSLGGPYVGLFAVKKDLVRMTPGRIVARAKDKNDRDGYVLTLQTREQHIRREKATSNICTNQALVALCALVYLSLVGPDGLKRAAANCYRGAHYLAGRLSGIKGVRRLYDGEFFNEFVVVTPIPAVEVVRRLLEKGIFVGPALAGWFPDQPNALLLAVTDKRRREELDSLVEKMRAAVS